MSASDQFCIFVVHNHTFSGHSIKTLTTPSRPSPPIPNPHRCEDATRKPTTRNTHNQEGHNLERHNPEEILPRRDTTQKRRLYELTRKASRLIN